MYYILDMTSCQNKISCIILFDETSTHVSDLSAFFRYNNGRNSKTYMNIQIFGINKDFDTKKAQRYFKERSIRFQYIDMNEKGMSKGEFMSVMNAVGLQNMINQKSKDKTNLSLLDYLSEDAKIDKLLELQHLIATPIVRNGRKASVGYTPDIYKKWEEEEKKV